MVVKSTHNEDIQRYSSVYLKSSKKTTDNDISKQAGVNGLDSIRINSQNVTAKVNQDKNESIEKKSKLDNKNTIPNENLKPDALKNKEINDAVDKANKVLFKNDTHLQFKIHEKTNDVVIKVVNDETGETLREFPSEKILDMVAKLWEIAGLFVDEKR